jgi:AAA+ superfamily predicted ATPase
MNSVSESTETRPLLDALVWIRLLLERHAARVGGKPFDERVLQAAHDRMQDSQAQDSPIEQLAERFRLSSFERNLLLLCAGMELEASLSQVCPQLLADRCPTFSLALAVLPDAHWSALSPASPLRYWRLIEPGEGTLLTLRPLRIDERILHFLVGIDELDQRLAATLQPLESDLELTQMQLRQAQRLVNAWIDPEATTTALLQVCGASAVERRAVAAEVSAIAELEPWLLQASALPTSAAELETYLRLWEREAALSEFALVVECPERLPEQAAGAGDEPMLQAFLERIEVPALISTQTRRPPVERTSITADLDSRHADRVSEQRQMWHAVLGSDAAPLAGVIERLIFQFSMSSSAIRSAYAEAVSALDPHTTQVTSVTAAEALWQACRAQARPRLDATVQRIDSRATWDDLIGTESQTELLRFIALQVRERSTVYGAWQFSIQGERGLGIAALFTGPSGTGKTLAAEVLAGELKLDLYRIDLSSVVSKYIGETEKNLRSAFDAAEAAGAILLFDEADAIFGKRSEVKDSRDRHANIEVSYLLQRMEAYRGLSILTTNLKDNLDQAFLRRIRFVIDFPFPDAALRARLWERAFPPQTPVTGLDFSRLARLSVAGGDIRNIALNAGFLAAGEASPVSMRHLRAAVRIEFSKLQRPVNEAEIAGWTTNS